MLEVKHLTKAYGQSYAVSDISFSVDKGEILGFLGTNGAGKSTTMNMLTGYLAMSSGEVLVDGIDLLQEPLKVKKKIGYLPEKPPLYMDMTVGEYLEFIYDLKGVRLCKKEHIQQIAKQVNIENVYHKMIKNLSKGYCQRIGIAQALIGDPPIIILDEPTVGLDPKQIIEVRELICQLGKTRTVILSSHILTEIQAVCDRIIVINKGKLVADERTEKLISSIKNASNLSVSISGEKDKITRTLLALDGVRDVKFISEKSCDEFEFHIEADTGVDLRRRMFFSLADSGFFITELRSAIKLENVFLSLTGTVPPDSLVMPEDKDKASIKEMEGNI